MAKINKEEWTTISIEKVVVKKLKDFKVHPNQSYSEVIKNIIKEIESEKYNV